MANEEKKVTITTAYRQNNYLILDNKRNSVSVSVYFKVSNKQILKPSMKAKIRSMKNSIHKYDEGQRLIRDLTADVQELPKRKQLTALVHYLIKYERLMDVKTFTILWKRLTDYQTLRHVEKSLLVIQHILSQKHPFYSHAFEKFCKDRKAEFLKLQNYHYKVDGSDIGQNVRTRATDIYKQLLKPPNIPPEYIESNIVPSLKNEVKNEVNSQIKQKKHKKKKKKKMKKMKKKKSKRGIVNNDDMKDEEQNTDVVEEDLLALNVNDFNSNNNINNSNDIFDIFGELPSSEQNCNINNNNNNTNHANSTNNGQDFMERINSNNGYNFPVRF